MSKALEWGRTGTVEAMAEWLRGKSDALCVIVVRRDDSVLAADPLLAPADVAPRVEMVLPELVSGLAAARAEKRRTARQQFAEVRE